MSVRCHCGAYLDTPEERRGGACDSCHREDREMAAWEQRRDELEAMQRSDVEGSVCVFCPALTMSPTGVCDSCRDGWGMDDRPPWTRQASRVPGRDPNWGQL